MKPSSTDRLALVTGASRGIGRAIAFGLARSGMKVIAHGRESSPDLDSVQQDLRDLNSLAGAVSVDLSDIVALTEFLDEFSYRVDVLILNASMEVRARWADATYEDAQRQSNTNFLSTVKLCQFFGPAMAQRGWGRIVGLGSIQERHPNPDLAVYAALKTAQTHYLRTLAIELASQGVTVNTLAPGVIATDRNRAVLQDHDVETALRARIPAGDIGTAEACVGAVQFLTSDAASYITGAWLPVDGGFHAA